MNPVHGTPQLELLHVAKSPVCQQTTTSSSCLSPKSSGHLDGQLVIFMLSSAVATVHM